MEYDSNKKLISATISQLRFPLMLGIVLLHCSLGETTVPLFNTFQKIFSGDLVSPCVPLFFFISGYLFFFKNQDNFTFLDYKIGLQKRISSILIPYIFWNTIVLLYFAIIHEVTPFLINPEFNNVYSYSAVDWMRSYWDYPGGQPVCYQFWFLRDLMVTILFTPIIYFIVKQGRWFIPAILVALYMYNIRLIPHQPVVTFFSLGAAFSVNRYDFTALAKLLFPISTLVFILSLI